MMNERQQVMILYKARKKSQAIKNGCIVWNGTRNKGGYGIIEYTNADKKRVCLPLHRALYIIHHKVKLQRFQYVCHKCDNPSCINIDHLWLGSPKENMEDMQSKGRKAKKHRPHTRFRKLTDDEVRAIRQDQGKYKYIALSFGITSGYVSYIKTRKAKTLVPD